MKTKIDSKGQLCTESDNVIVISDLHIPLHDQGSIDMMLKYAREKGVKDLIINGDFVNQDAFSKYPRKDPAVGWDRESDEAVMVSDQLQLFFDNIAYVMANHDLRASKRTDWILTAKNLIRILFNEYDGKTIHYTAYDHCILNDSFLICHPDKYSAKPCKLAGDFAKAYGKNVIVGHTHLLNHHRIGGLHLIDGGCLTDQTKTQYVQQCTTTFPTWKLGFVHIVNNEPEVIAFSEPISIKKEW